MKLVLDPNSVESYRQFLAVKRLPVYHVAGRIAWFPDEYASELGIKVKRRKSTGYTPLDSLFDYQRDIARLAIQKQRFAVFAQCGLGKSLILLEFARHAAKQLSGNRCVLIVSPLMVVKQTMHEAERFYGDSLEIEQVPSGQLGEWLASGSGKIGITNYEALREDIDAGRLGGLILDESSMLKSHYGKYGQECIRLGRGLEWKLCLTGTPAPNDRIEYANHAVFLDHVPTVNAFLAKYFVNRGQTDNRWELKPHALGPFYLALSHWCIFLEHPSTYGWKDNCDSIPPIHVHIDHVPLTPEQESIVRAYTGGLFATNPGGITTRSVLGRLAKGTYKDGSVPTLKYDFIEGLVNSWPDESTIIWCLYNDEQEALERVFPDAASISGDTPLDRRIVLIEEFLSGARKVLISKPKLLGFGLNLQVATRHIFSGLADSYESYWQAVKRSNRIGSTRPLNVHIPVTDLERPMIDTVLRKAKRIQQDAEEQERIFRQHGYNVLQSGGAA
jgi:superfamily II DNA or RNA helicase